MAALCQCSKKKKKKAEERGAVVPLYYFKGCSDTPGYALAPEGWKERVNFVVWFEKVCLSLSPAEFP